MNNLPRKIKSVDVRAFGENVGTIVKTANYSFDYDGKATLCLPLKTEQRVINSGELPIYFAQHLPEGYVRRFVSDMLKREAVLDDLYFLALQGSKGIGHLSYQSEIKFGNSEQLKLEDILGWKGDGLFETLLTRYYQHGLASGVQPKSLVPLSIKEKGRTIRQSEFIVKTAVDEFENLAINEFFCMTAAKNAGLSTPNFWLSENKENFVVERFDIIESGKLAVDDFSVLSGQGQAGKYNGSYEAIIKLCELFGLDKTDMYKQIVFHCLIGNGDAHLKNFSVYYDDQIKPELTPVYDITHTECYDHLDNRLALKLCKARTFPSKSDLIKLGKERGIDQPGTIVEQVSDSLSDSLSSEVIINEFKGLKRSIEKSLARGSVIHDIKKVRHDKNRRSLKS